MNKSIIAALVFVTLILGGAGYYGYQKLDAKLAANTKERQAELKKVVDSIVEVLDHQAAGRILLSDTSYNMCPMTGLGDTALPCWAVKDGIRQIGNSAVVGVWVVNTTSIELTISASNWTLTKENEKDMKLFSSPRENTSEAVVVKAGYRGLIEVRLPSRDIKDVTGVGLRLHVTGLDSNL